jgi:hypothetical protein
MVKTFIRALVALGALAAFGAAGVALSTGDTTDRPAAVADDPGTDPLAGDRARRIPTAITPEARHGCGGLPIAFDDPEAGYSLCYPQGYGFLILTEAAPRADLDAIEAASVRLADPTAFPWVAGTLPLDAASRGATIIEITTLPSFTPSPEAGDCTPDSALHPGARICDLRLDPMSAAPDPAGSVLELLSVHELDGRVAVARSYLPADATDEQLAQVRSILTTIRPLASGAAS